MTIYDAVPYSDCLGFMRRTSRRGGRAVECGGLENRCWGYSSTEGSNPSLSAISPLSRIRETLLPATASNPSLIRSWAAQRCRPMSSEE